ncbi:MAG: trypsin-like peptidase domain-containing protein [Bryobacterales bacterium]|nr:trypsin-like peptidase domain-containing protein [Bryobacterales bacterium]
MQRLEEAVFEGVASEPGVSWLGPTRDIPPGVDIGPQPGNPLAGHGRWTQIGGIRVWRATIRSPGARAVRLRLVGFGTRGRVFVYPAGSSAGHTGPYTGRGPRDVGDFWTGVVVSDAVTVEYVEDPAGRQKVESPFRIAALAHLVSIPGGPPKSAALGPGAPSFLPLRRSVASCHLDVSCHPEWQDPDFPSSVQLLVTDEDATLQCTGTLVNSRYGFQEHLLMLTAGHCIQGADEAANAVFTWNYQTDRCNGVPPPPSALVMTEGSDLLALRHDYAGDFALLRLDARDVRAVTSWTALGWAPDPVVSGAQLAMVSHPGFSFRRISFGTAVPTDWTDRRAGTFTGIRWSRGAAEHGSSGAGAVRLADGLLVGIVVGGAAGLEACDPDQRAVLLRFRDIFAETREFFESASAVEDAVPAQANEVKVSLGDGGDTLTLVRAGDDTYWLGDEQVTSGSEIGVPDGRKYRLVQSDDGTWTAELLERPVTLRLPGGAELAVRDTVDGRFWLGDTDLTAGSGITHAELGTQQVVPGPSPGDWRFEHVPSGIPLGSHGLTYRPVAGSGLYGFAGDGGSSLEARLANPSGVAVGSDGAMYISDTDNHRIRRIGPDGLISTLAGTGEAGFAGDGRSALEARLRAPRGLAVGPDGSLFVADTGNHRIRAIDRAGIIRTVAGVGEAGFAGDGSSAMAAMLSEPAGLAVGTDGAVYIADSGNHRIRRVLADRIDTIAGVGLLGYGGDGGPAGRALLRFPKGVALDGAGNLFVADTGNNRVRRIAPDGRIATLMGTGERGRTGDGGPAASATLAIPRGVAASDAGEVYVTDTGNNALRRVAANGIAATITGVGAASQGSAGGPSTDARLHQPFQAAIGPNGSLLIADARNNRVVALEPGWTVVPSQDMPSSVEVSVGGSGYRVRVLRAREGQHFYAGVPIQDGDLIAGWPFRRFSFGEWDGVTYRVSDRSALGPGLGWAVEPAAVDPSEAARTTQALRRPGISEVLFRLGLLYKTARDMRELPPRYAELLTWLLQPVGREAPEGTEGMVQTLRESAGRGDPAAQAALADLHRRYESFGPSLAQDYEAALRWYGLSAAQGNAAGQYGLGVLHAYGLGVPQDAAVGAQWLRRAAQQGHAGAQRQMGLLHEDGSGVAHDSAAAAYWYRLAADRGEPWAQISLGWMLVLGNSSEAEVREGARWILRAAQRGYDGGQAAMGWLNEQGKAGAQDLAQATRWYRLSAVQGNAYAQWRLGEAYANGNGVRQDDVVALVWLELAVQNGEARARIGREGVRRSLSEAQLSEAGALAAKCLASEYADCP